MATLYVEKGKEKKKKFSFLGLSFQKEKEQELVEADMEYLAEAMKESEPLQEEIIPEVSEEENHEQREVKVQEQKMKPKEKRTDRLEREKSFLFEKAFTCPVCDKSFQEKLVKGKRVRLLRTDRDLRPIHNGIDTGKYDVVVCPHCGYAALTRYFKLITDTQVSYIKNTITPTFQELTQKKDVYSYADALSRYKLVLANAVIKQAKISEKAYICLKTAWILRGMSEEIGDEAEENIVFLKECQELENQYLRQAYEGFLIAMENESFPICGMDEMTIYYLLAALAYRGKHYTRARKLLQHIAKAHNLPPRLQEKTELLQELIDQKLEIV